MATSTIQSPSSKTLKQLEASPWLAVEPGLAPAAIRWRRELSERRESFQNHADGIARFGVPSPLRAIRHTLALQVAQVGWLVREFPKELNERTFMDDRGTWAKRTAATLMREQLAMLGPSAAEVMRLVEVAEGVLPTVIVEIFRKRPIAVRPISKTTVSHIIRRELGDCVAWYDPQPMLVEPVNQLHRARLGDGREVDLRIRRPGVSRALRQDARILATMAAPLQQFIPFFTDAHPVGFVQLVTRQVLEEVDLRNQALNLVELALALESMGLTGMEVARPIPSLVTRHALVTEHLEGTSLTEGMDGLDMAACGEAFAAAAIEAGLARGVFHADLVHESLVVRPNGNLGVIGCSTMGRFDVKTRRAALAYLTAFFTADHAGQVYAMDSLGAISDDIDKDQLIKDLSNAERLQFGALMSGGSENITEALKEGMSILLDHRVRPPLEAVLFVRNVFCLNRFVKERDPEASAIDMLMPIVQRLPELARQLRDLPDET